MRERKTLIRQFQDDLQDRVDQALKDGVTPHDIKQVLEDEVTSDLELRRQELLET